MKNKKTNRNWDTTCVYWSVSNWIDNVFSRERGNANYDENFIKCLTNMTNRAVSENKEMNRWTEGKELAERNSCTWIRLKNSPMKCHKNLFQQRSPRHRLRGRLRCIISTAHKTKWLRTGVPEQNKILGKSNSMNLTFDVIHLGAKMDLSCELEVNELKVTLE